ncbi:MAG: PHP domain-containing protein, partial [Pseudomonadota bacterium]|nr:PHP domain-containing protein [Pseudomonadota bacterium]
MIEVNRDLRPVEAFRRDLLQSGAGAPGYAELCVTSNFTFLTGASHPEELIARAAELGLEAIAITDRNSLAGVVRAFSALKELRREAEEAIRIRSQCRTDSCSRQELGNAQGISRPSVPKLPRLIIGCRLVLRDSPVDWIALPRDRAAYQRLTRLLSLGKRRAGKGECHLDMADMLRSCTGMILIALPRAGVEVAEAPVRQVRKSFPGHVFVGAAPRYDGSDQAWLNACARLAQKTSAPMVAVGDVLMHRASRKQLADVLTCMRAHITIDQIGTRALPNAERRLKGGADMARLFRDHPAALRRTLEIAARCAFCLSELSYEYPDETSQGEAPQERLERLAREGLGRR